MNSPRGIKGLFKSSSFWMIITANLIKIKEKLMQLEFFSFEDRWKNPFRIDKIILENN
jgi:hypothetical protein